jgi:pentalenolactone synthase
MRLLKPRVEELVDDLLTKLATGKPPVDLHEALSFPLPVLVICELLGVPFADREQFRTWSTGMADQNDRELATKSMDTMNGYLLDLVARKRAEPADDILSELLAIEDGTLTDDYVAGMGTIVLFAGHETTVGRIDIGTLLLLTHPDQRAELIADPAKATGAVEEILRRSSAVGGPSRSGLPRYAREDIEIGGVTVRTGEAILLASNAANHDERAFPNADGFDIDREWPSSHLAFGHGARYCIGATLARTELHAVFGTLFQRFPTMELAVPVSDLRWRSNLVTGGFAELPITW